METALKEAGRTACLMELYYLILIFVYFGINNLIGNINYTSFCQRRNMGYWKSAFPFKLPSPSCDLLICLNLDEWLWHRKAIEGVAIRRILDEWKMGRQRSDALYRWYLVSQFLYFLSLFLFFSFLIYFHENRINLVGVINLRLFLSNY
jgi:hypothetical protein